MDPVFMAKALLLFWAICAVFCIIHAIYKYHRMITTMGGKGPYSMPMPDYMYTNAQYHPQLGVLFKVLDPEKYTCRIEVAKDPEVMEELVYIAIKEREREDHRWIFKEPVEGFPSDVFITKLMLQFG